MNSDSVKSLAIKIFIMALTALATHLHLNVPNAEIYAFATDAVDGALLLYGWYRSYGMKLVPREAFAIQTQADPKSITHVVDAGGQIAAKVVGALLIVFTLSQFVQAVPASAQTKDPSSVLKAFAVSDLQAALDDANAQNPPDTVAAICYAALIPIVQAAQSPFPTPGKGGIFLALQKGRDLVSKVNQVKANVGPIADAKNKCAAVILDTQNFLVQLGVMGAGAVFKPF